MSASQWANKAHSIEDAESLVYRRTSSSSPTSDANNNDDNNSNDKGWKLVSKGLPNPTGTLISVLAANPKVAREFYAANNCGIFCSTDSGISWNIIDGIEWPKEYLSQHPRALAIREDKG